MKTNKHSLQAQVLLLKLIGMLLACHPRWQAHYERYLQLAAELMKCSSYRTQEATSGEGSGEKRNTARERFTRNLEQGQQEKSQIYINALILMSSFSVVPCYTGICKLDDPYKHFWKESPLSVL